MTPEAAVGSLGRMTSRITKLTTALSIALLLTLTACAPPGQTVSTLEGGLHWEKISEFAYRTPTPGGWLVQRRIDGGALTYVPDPNHEWATDGEGR